MSRTIVAIFDVYSSAEKAAMEVREKGLRTDNISIIVKDNGNRGYLKPVNGGDGITAEFSAYPFSLNRSTRIADGIITGGIFGGATGIVLGAVSMFVPRLGLVAAGGPLTGLVAGFVLGGILGIVIDLRIPKSKKERYYKLISDGNAVFSMKVDEERMEEIIEIIKQNGAMFVEKY